MIEIVIHQSALDEKWYVAFRGGNHEIWFTSQGYESPYDARRSVSDFLRAIYEQSTFVVGGVPGFDINLTIVDKQGRDVALKEDD